MTYYLDIFSPETYETFSASERNLSGFRMRQLKTAQRIQPGDKFLCYMTKLSRWIGVLEITSESFVDNSPLFYTEDDPFVVRFQVKPIIWLSKENAIPIREDQIWNTLSFTKGHDKHSSSWTGKFRSSLTEISERDGKFLEKELLSQEKNRGNYPVDEVEYRKYLKQRIRRADKVVTVSIPTDKNQEDELVQEEQIPVRESIKYQAFLAQIGAKMGFSVWIPRNDKGRVIDEMKSGRDSIIDILPLNYDVATLQTVEQIDILWLRKRSIVRAFEVEHTTAIYSGILRMADLLALQPNMDIKLHIVAPNSRREKVFQEIQRPVFSLLEKGALSDFCTFISYESIDELAKLKHLAHLSDSVLEEYQEEAE